MRKCMKKWWKPAVLFLILLGFLLYPPAVLAEIRVDFEDESYVERYSGRKLLSAY